jgi:phosphoglycerate dehydrogenase-like enzyme
MNDNTLRRPTVLIWERVVPGDDCVARLQAQGLDVRLGRPNRDASYRRHRAEDFVADAQGCVGALISGGIRITPEVLAALPDLRVISKIGIGVDTVDVAAASAAGVAVCNTPAGNDTVFVAEHAFALMLALAKQLHVWTRSYMQGGGWRRPDVHALGLDGRTLGIVGLGRIGRELARRAAGWNMHVLAHDPWAQEPPAGVDLVALDELLARSEVLSLHCPALPGGAPLLDAPRLALLRRGVLLVNTARASLLDRAAMLAALDDGRLAGVALDVFDPEPPASDDPLLAHPRVMCTPHVASWTHEAFMGRRSQATDNLALVVLGRAGASVVNAQALHAQGAA